MCKNSGHILIADAGGTGTDWCVMSASGEIVTEQHGSAINAGVMSREEVRSAMMSAAPLFADADEIHFYGAGCIGAASEVVKDILAEFVHGCPITVNSDIVGAARSLFGHESGIVCILGTGSNSCYYDGQQLTSKVPPLGYILGDEGSGAAIGKRFLKAYLRGNLNEELRQRMSRQVDLSLDTVIERVYRTPGANKYLASFTRLPAQYIEDTDVYTIIADEFEQFFRNVVLVYEEAHSVPLGFVGSVAYHFSTVLKDVAVRHGVEIGKIEKNPMPGLIRYHSRSSKIPENEKTK